MKILRKILVLSMILMMTCTLAGYTKNNACASLNVNNNFRELADVAVLLYDLNDLYSIKLRQSFEDIQKENPDKVEFSFYDAKNNAAVQNEILDSLIKSRIDLLIVSPTNSNEATVKDIINKIKGKNVPIILFGIDPQVIQKVSREYDKAVFAGIDMEGAAIIQGKIIADLWNTNKNSIDKNNDNTLQYVILSGAVNSPIAIVRTKYVISTINDLGIKTEQLELINADWSKELASGAVESLFLKYDDKIEAIIATNDAMAIGAIEALQKYGYNAGDENKKIVVVGIDGMEEAKNLIDKGFMTGTVIQDPKVFAEGLYTIGINLINKINPLENTNFKVINDTIIIPENYQPYTGKTSAP